MLDVLKILSVEYPARASCQFGGVNSAVLISIVEILEMLIIVICYDFHFASFTQFSWKSHEYTTELTIPNLHVPVNYVCAFSSNCE